MVVVCRLFLSAYRNRAISIAKMIKLQGKLYYLDKRSETKEDEKKHAENFINTFLDGYYWVF